MTAPNKMAKRAAAGTLALAVCLTGGAIGAGAAHAATGFKFDQRIEGETRVETAIEASKRTFPNSGTAKAVVLVNGDREVDGLTASYVAGLQDASILYVTSNSISAATKAEIDRLGTKNIFLVGGTTVLSTSLENSLKSDGYTIVNRYGGDDRYETAALVAKSGTGKPGKVFITSGERLADALVVGPIATAKDYPILLVRPTEVPRTTSSALSSLDVTTRIVVGGTTVVSPDVASDVKSTSRLAGDNRQATAIKVADEAIKSEGFKKDSLALIGSGNNNAADALVAAPFAAQQLVPLLFVDAGSETTTQDYLKSRAADLTGAGYVFGGTNAVSSAVAEAATKAAGGTEVKGNQTIAVSPGTTESRGLVDENTGTQAEKDADNRVYTASGLQNDKDYRITLVDSSNIAVDAAGVVTFKSSADTASRTGFSADTGANNGVLVKVNGGAPVFAADAAAAARTTVTKAANGTITFEVDGLNAGDVTPVVYLNGGAGIADAQGGTSARLETNAKAAGEYATPTESFGLGGKTTFTAVSNQTITVSSSDSVVNVISDGSTANANRGLRSYTATLPSGTTAVKIVLFSADSIVVGSNGKVTLKDDPNNGQADGYGLGAGAFEVVNGVPASGKVVSLKDLKSTSLQFSVDATAAGAAVPVIFVDSDNDEQLDLDASDAPTESFGVGGAVRWIPTEAAAGAIAANEITFIDEEKNFIVTAGGTYYYDDNDLFYVEPTAAVTGNAVALDDAASFETKLSVGDSLLVATTAYSGMDATATYGQSPAEQSKFVLSNIDPVAPTAVTAGTPKSSSVVLTGTGIKAGATVTLYRGTTNVFADATKVTSTSSDSDSTASNFQIEATGLSANTAYYFWLTQTVNSEESAERLITSGPITTAPATIDSAPVSLKALVADEDTVGALGKDDRIVVTFNEALAALKGGEEVTVGDGTDTATLTNGSGATFALNADGTILTIALSATPAGTGPIATTGAATLFTDAEGVKDVSGLEWAPDNTYGVGDIAIGETSIPGSTPVAPLTPGGGATAATVPAGALTINNTQLTANKVVPGAIVTVVVDAVNNANDATYTTVASSTGTFSVTLKAAAATGDAVSITQRVVGVPASGATADTV